MDLVDSIRKKPRFAIAIVLSITMIFSLSILFNGIKYEFNEESFLPDNDVVRANKEVLTEYEDYYYVVVLAKSRDGNILNKEDMLEILEIEKKVNESLNAKSFSFADFISSIFLMNENKEINYENRIEVMERKGNEDIKQLLHFLSKIIPSSYLSIFLSNDFDGEKANATIIQFSLNSSLIFNEKEALEKERIIERIISEEKTEHIEAIVLGGKIIEEDIMRANKKSIAILLPLSLLLVIIILLLTYKNLWEVAISLIILFLSILWVYGVASIMHFSLNPISASIPVLLAGIGIDYSIHMILRIKEGENEKIVFSALLLSTITTAIGFLSNVVSSISLLQQFGILASFGIFSCFSITILLVPSIDELKNFEKVEKTKFVRNVIVKMVKKASHHKTATISAIFLVTAFLFISSLNLTSEYDIKDFLPKNLKISRDARYLISNFNFSTGEIDVLIKGNVTSAHLLHEIKSSVDNISDSHIVKIESILSLMHDYATNDSIFDLNYNESFSEMYSKVMENDLPKKNATYEEIKELYDWIYKHGRHVLHKNAKYDGTLIRIHVSTKGEKKEVEKLYEKVKKGIRIDEKHIITGSTITAYVVMNAFQKSQIESIILALILSFVVMSIVFIKKYGSVILAIFALIPVILSTIWILGTMSILGISLTVTTITVASISIGLGIDYSIHVVNEFATHREIERVAKNTGHALMASAMTTIFAFALLSFSLLPPIKTFGFLISLSILFAFLASMFVLPLLLDIIKK
ncbi:MAG: MMPL family transporter [Thermoplasmata archaeon]|nr:MMPL family transporter [Thermoplasmata archaeon]